jgi:hypothetical protein
MKILGTTKHANLLCLSVIYVSFTLSKFNAKMSVKMLATATLDVFALTTLGNATHN